MTDDKPPIPIVTGPPTSLSHFVPTHVLPNGSGGPHGTKGPKMPDQIKVGSDLPPYIRRDDEDEVERSPQHGKRGPDKKPRQTRHGTKTRSSEAIGALKKRFNLTTHDIAVEVEVSDSYIMQMEVSGEMPGWMRGNLENIARKLGGSDFTRHSNLYVVTVPKDKDEPFQNICKGFSLAPKKIELA